MADTRNFTRIPHTEAGTWLDGSHGWTNSYRVVDRAEAWGWDLGKADGEDVAEVRRIVQAYRDGVADDDDSEEMIRISNEATDYLCGIAPWGYTFGWEAGELSLYETRMDAQETHDLDRTCDAIGHLIDEARNYGPMDPGTDDIGPSHVSVLDHAEDCDTCRETLADFISEARQARAEERKG